MLGSAARVLRCSLAVQLNSTSSVARSPLVHSGCNYQT